jgi:hypothetical protein
MVCPELGEVLAVEGTADDATVAVGMGADRPALADRSVRYLVAVDIFESPATPDIVVEDRLHEKQLV